MFSLVVKFFLRIDGGWLSFAAAFAFPAEFITLFFSAIYIEEIAFELLGLCPVGPNDTEFLILMFFSWLLLYGG